MNTPPNWCHSKSGGKQLVLILHVQPGAKRTEIVGLHAGALKIKLAAPPVEGAANGALLTFLAEIFGVPHRQVVLKQGARSRRKIIEIENPSQQPEAIEALRPLVASQVLRSLP